MLKPLILAKILCKYKSKEYAQITVDNPVSNCLLDDPRFPNGTGQLKCKSNASQECRDCVSEVARAFRLGPNAETCKNEDCHHSTWQVAAESCQ